MWPVEKFFHFSRLSVAKSNQLVDTPYFILCIHLVQTNDSEDEQPIIIRRKKEHVIKRSAMNFVDQEAELSGDEAGSDEDEDGANQGT